MQVGTQDILGAGIYQVINIAGQNSGPPSQKSLYSTHYLHTFPNQLLGISAKLEKAAISFFSVYLNVHPHGKTQFPLGRIFMKLYIMGFY